LEEEGKKMMEAKLGVTTCDKCQDPMREGQPVLIITEGNISKSNDTLTFDGSCIHYACHLNCWNGTKEFLEEVGNDNLRRKNRS
jgi:hypothetical protein